MTRSYDNIVPDGTRISSGFSPSRVNPVTGVRRQHAGVDIAAPNGSPIYTPRDGTVVHVGNDPKGYGNYAVIQHTLADGTVVRTLYAHLDEPSGLQVGDAIATGDQVGNVGSTGGSTGNHLHYEERLVAPGAENTWQNGGWKKGTIPVDPATDPFGFSGDDNPSPEEVGGNTGGPFTDPNPWWDGTPVPGDANGNGIPDILEGTRDKFDDSKNTSSPIILDLDGDGVETKTVNQGAWFDHDANSFAESTGWVGGDDGLLVRDLDGNGRIDSGRELFGNNTLLASGQKAANGFEALKDLDSNLDGVIDSNDVVWSTLKVWKDADGDGYTADGELISLEEAGIQSLNLNYNNSTSVDANGNQHKQLGSYTKADGTVAAATDVWFNVDRLNSIAENWLEVPEDVAELPDLRGYGNVFDLHQAIVRDATGQLQQLVEQFSVAATKVERESLIDSIIIHWAGAQNIAAGSRGSYIDAKKLTALEAFMGEGLGKNPGRKAAPKALSAYNDLKEYFYNQLTAQTVLQPFYNAIEYQFDVASESIKLNLVGVADVLSTNLAVNRQAALELLAEFMRGTKALGAYPNIDHYSFIQAIVPLGTDVVAIVQSAWAFTIGGDGDDTITDNSGNDTIYGGAGNDTITDNGGNDLIDGGDGDDIITDNSGTNTLRGGGGNDTITFGVYASNTLEGGDGDDLIKVDNNTVGRSIYVNHLTGGKGNDILRSGGSADTYYFNRGDGQDTINDYGYHATASYVGLDKLVFGESITTADISATRVGNHLVIRIADPENPEASDQITIQNWSDVRYRIESFEFADGTVWDAWVLSDMAVSAMVSDGADTITAWVDTTYIDGLGGDDTIAALGSNTTIYGGEGNDTITDSGGNNTIDGGDGDDSISVAYGNDLIDGGAGNDVITDGGGNDTIYGGAGNDTITDNYGNDLIDGGEGDDIITDLGGGTNTLRGGLGNDTITFSYYASNTLEGGDGDDLIKVDNNTVGRSIYVNHLTGGRGNDILRSGGSADTYYFNRGDGQDTINDYGYHATASYVGLDKLVFGESITTADISATRVGNHLVIRIADPENPEASDQITIQNWSDVRYRIESFEFADGTVWDAGVLSDMAVSAMVSDGADTITAWVDTTYIDGLGGDDTIAGASSHTTIYGGAGNDTITDSGGNDLIDGGDGDDIITDSNYGTDVIYGGAGNDTITDSGGTNDLIDGGDGADTITAGSGTATLRGGSGNDTITFNSYGKNIIEGGDGDDLIKVDNNTLGRSTYINHLTGGRGNDILRSGGSADTYYFNRGDGQDTINDYGYNSTNASYVGLDKLVFGAGITTDDISAVRAGNHLVFSIADPDNPEASDQITIQNWSDVRYRIESFEFADGTVWAANNLKLLPISYTGTENSDSMSGWDGSDYLVGLGGDDFLNGGAGNDVMSGGFGVDNLTDTTGNNLFDAGEDSDSMTGGSANDLFIGGTGNDSIITGAGYDIIAFNSGDGQDTVNASTGADNSLSLGGGINYSDLQFTKSGNNLILKTGGIDQITFKDWYTGSNKSVANLQVIAEAMADFDASGSDTLLDNKIETFDFVGLVSAFDQARAADTSITSWSLSDALLDFHLSGSDAEAIGGDLAYQYGINGSLSGMGLNAAQGVMGAANFGQSAQTLNAPSTWQNEAVKLA